MIKFKSEPTPGTTSGIKPHLAVPLEETDPLGPLSALKGQWKGTGFNAIWRPVFGVPGQDRFLELNLTKDSIKFDNVIGDVPNRGLLQADLHMTGLTYFQTVLDVSTNLGLHVEPGIWAVAPPTTKPQIEQTVVRMASIPHGTAILAQGTAKTIQGGFEIPDVNLLPFLINSPSQPLPSSEFSELNISIPTQFRTAPGQMAGITQDMVDNPNSVLKQGQLDQEIISTTVLEVSTVSTPVPGGGTANTAFLLGDPPQTPATNPNAVAAECTAVFWIETVKGTPDFLQLQYSQMVLLNFKGLSWPHISVGTLKKLPPSVAGS